MRKIFLFFIPAVLALSVLTGCGGYNKILKASDYGTKYSLAKNLYVEGRFTTCSSVLEECVVMLHGTSQGEESMFLLASCYFNLRTICLRHSIFRIVLPDTPTDSIPRAVCL